MNLSANDVNELLIAEDVEGYIALGAPPDEYFSEASMIAEAISRLVEAERTSENVRAILLVSWRTFELSSEEMQLRLPAIERLADRIAVGLTTG